ncbi:hypothetical protein D3C74_475170 [compost metagenome]
MLVYRNGIGTRFHQQRVQLFNTFGKDHVQATVGEPEWLKFFVAVIEVPIGSALRER